MWQTVLVFTVKIWSPCHRGKKKLCQPNCRVFHENKTLKMTENVILLLLMEFLSLPLPATPTGCEFKNSTNCQSHGNKSQNPPPDSNRSVNSDPPRDSSSSGNSQVRNRKKNSQAERKMEKETTKEERAFAVSALFCRVEVTAHPWPG